jgi:dTDP-L-rhamnose 4-epimerase
MKVLITGGAGFIGQHLSRKLINNSHEVTVLDNFNKQVHDSQNLPSDLKDSINLIEGDMRDRKNLIKALSKDTEVIVHLAAETGTGQSMYDIANYYSVNVQGTASLLDYLQNDFSGGNLQSILVASSRSIYGEGAYLCQEHGLVFPDQRTNQNLSIGQFDPLCPNCSKKLILTPTPETAPFKPLSHYAITKLVQEKSILLFAKTRKLNGFALRYQNVYGPGQSLSNPYTGILAIFSNLCRQDKLVEVFEDGLESRDFVFIDDVIEATFKCILHNNFFCGPLNIGSGESVSVIQVAKSIKKILKSQSKITINKKFRTGDIRHNVADISHANELLNLEKKLNFNSGLKKFLKWTENEKIFDTSEYRKSLGILEKKGLIN